MATKIEKIPENALCPYTGRPIDIVYSESLLCWKGVAPFYSTKWFKTKRELMWHLLAREGKPPGFPRVLHIEIRDGQEQRERDRAAAEDAQMARDIVAGSAQVTARIDDTLKKRKSQ